MPLLTGKPAWYLEPRAQDQHHDDHAIHPSPGSRSDRLSARHIFLALQSLGRQFENPAKDHRGNEPDHQQNDDGAGKPFRCPKHWQHCPGHLHDQPCADEIESRHADDIAALQLTEEILRIHRLGFPIRTDSEQEQGLSAFLTVSETNLKILEAR